MLLPVFAMTVVSEAPSDELESLDWVVGRVFGLRILKRMRARAPSPKTVPHMAMPTMAAVERPPDLVGDVFCELEVGCAPLC